MELIKRSMMVSFCFKSRERFGLEKSEAKEYADIKVKIKSSLKNISFSLILNIKNTHNMINLERYIWYVKITNKTTRKSQVINSCQEI